MTISRGSTSWAIKTRVAFFCSTKAVMCLIPYLTTLGFWEASTCLPSVRALATATRRFFFSALVSGACLSNNLKSWVAVFLSRVRLNWLTEGGTFNRYEELAFVAEDGHTWAISPH